MHSKDEMFTVFAVVPYSTNAFLDASRKARSFDAITIFLANNSVILNANLRPSNVLHYNNGQSTMYVYCDNIAHAMLCDITTIHHTCNILNYNM